MSNFTHRPKPAVSKHRCYSVSEVADLVNRTRKTVLADVAAGLLNGSWGEVRTKSKSWQRGKPYTHVAQGWTFAGKEVQQYIDYRFACIGNRSVDWKRGLKPSAAELVLDHGYTIEGAALELGIRLKSVRKCVEREAAKRGTRGKV